LHSKTENNLILTTQSRSETNFQFLPTIHTRQNSQGLEKADSRISDHSRDNQLPSQKFMQTPLELLRDKTNSMTLPNIRTLRKNSTEKSLRKKIHSRVENGSFSQSRWNKIDSTPPTTTRISDKSWLINNSTNGRSLTLPNFSFEYLIHPSFNSSLLFHNDLPFQNVNSLINGRQRQSFQNPNFDVHNVIPQNRKSQTAPHIGTPGSFGDDDDIWQ
jgi:hypothetical protein